MTAQVIDFQKIREQKWKEEATRELLEALGVNLPEHLIKKVVHVEEMATPKEEDVRYYPAYCDPNNEKKGNKYEETRNLDIKEIAKMIRKDIKEAIKAGDLPKGLKTSVKIERFSGGQSINIRVKKYEGKMYSEKYVQHHIQNPHQGFFGDRYEIGLKNTLKTLEDILQSYNRDNSDSMSDYFDVRFYGHADVDHDLRYEKAEEEIEKLK
jgi:hypothetical protein